MEKNEISAIDAYLNRIYKIILVIVPTAALMASVCFTIFKIVGWYESVSVAALAAFDVYDIVLACISAYFFRTCLDEKGMIIKDKLKNGKIFLSLAIIIQWNFISYLVPAREWWAFAFFFILLTAFFFDTKMIFLVSVGIVISTVISWFINDNMMVPDTQLYYPDLILRIICITLSIVTLIALTYFGGKLLVSELEKYVNYDTLTHLLNRRSMDNYLDEAYKQATTGKTTFCLLMMDIDDFKHVNDTYGHECGDEVLRRVAHIISTGVKKDDFVFRWGGEEILVLLKTDLTMAEAAAERIRQDIERDIINYRDGVEVQVTITIGIAPYVTGATIKSMMEEADSKLYYGKKNGKNQVVTTLASDNYYSLH